MPDPEVTSDATSEPGATPGDPTENDPSPSTGSDAELGDRGKKALADMRREVRAAQRRAEEAERRIKEREDAEKSDLERATAERDELRTRLTTLEREAMQRTAAAEVGIAKHWKRLQGATPQELAEDAKTLAEEIAGQQPEPLVPDLGAGPRPTSLAKGNAGMNTLIRRRAGYGSS